MKKWMNPEQLSFLPGLRTQKKWIETRQLPSAERRQRLYPLRTRSPHPSSVASVKEIRKIIRIIERHQPAEEDQTKGA